MLVDPNALAKTASALARPLVKLIEVVETGIAAIGRPFMLIIHAHADGRAKLIREGYAHRLKRLKEQNRAELIAATTPAVRELPAKLESPSDEIEVAFEEAETTEAIAQRVMETERQAQRRANVVTIAAEAADSIPNEVSEEPVSADWIARFFADAQEVSCEDLQKMWGKVLAREVAKPGSVSLRTLAILRDLSVEEGRLFERFATYCASGGVYVRVPGDGLLLHELVALQDAGLVEPSRRNFAWHEIDEKDPGFAVARARFEDKFTNRLRPTPYVKAALGYPSGHGLHVHAAASSYQADLYVVRRSAAPLLQVVSGTTSLAYLRTVVAHLNSQGFFQAWVREPTWWTGEPFGEGTVAPGASALAPQEGAGGGNPTSSKAPDDERGPAR